MNLREFINETLSEIALGINQARIEVKDFVAIVPHSINGEPVHEKMFVNFDIAVIASEIKSREQDGAGNLTGEVKVIGASLSGKIGGKGRQLDTTQNENVSRIQFKVPINLTANYRNAKGLEEDKQLLQEIINRKKK